MMVAKQVWAWVGIAVVIVVALLVRLLWQQGGRPFSAYSVEVNYAAMAALFIIMCIALVYFVRKSRNA